MSRPHVIFVSNDIVPGCGLPVAAPGMRVYGLACGMAARGFPVTTIVLRGPLERQWKAAIPPSLPANTVALATGQLAPYLEQQAPAVVVITNANQIDRMPEAEGLRYVLDFFAPKLLELVYEGGPAGPYPVEELRVVRERKLRGIQRADAFIVNGAKKLPYFLAWLLQTDRDIRTLPLELVNMCLPSAFAETARAAEGPVSFALAGYLQGWSVPGPWLRALSPHLAAGACTLDAMLPEHWGGASGFANPELNRLVEAHAIRVHHAKTLSEYQRFLAQRDVALDLFDWTRERELAVVTRTVAALCCGVPVVHPPFTEVSPLIAEYDAGWLVDPASDDAVAETLAAIVADRDAIARKRAGARRLWAEQFDPEVAVRGLAEIAERLTAEVAVA